MLDEIKGFHQALGEIPYAQEVTYGFVVLLVLFALYRIIVKKDNKVKAIIIKIVSDAIIDARRKGITVEIVVDDVLAKAEKKILEKPDPYDALLIRIIRCKWFRRKMIASTTKLIEQVVEKDAYEQAIKEAEAKKLESEAKG